MASAPHQDGFSGNSLQEMLFTEMLLESNGLNVFVLELFSTGNNANC